MSRSISHGDYLIELTKRCSCTPGSRGYVTKDGKPCETCVRGEVLTDDGRSIVELVKDFSPNENKQD